MSYCRFSTNDFQCDVYVYETVWDSWQIHVAGNRPVYKEPLPPEVPFPEEDEGPESPGFHAWYERYLTVQRMVGEADREYIDLPNAGKTFGYETPGECAAKLEELKEIGFIVPQYVIDELKLEQEERDSVEQST